ncbi:uncharacterized protein LOC125029654 [Penaeus chinensis]|uniref:uncharacterized protein LOC125029654 n=1 Tax=Penaeus chinensis TaxID=139456 RepID=UPI001FB742A2|nr:uncharacterized protein LOC125029654 [Penaeus chinensis]
MHIVRCMLVCFVWSSLILILAYLSEVTYQGSIVPHTYYSESILPNFSVNSFEKKEVLFQGEVFIPEAIKRKINTGSNRTGLKLLSSLYEHLPSVTTKYSSVSPQVEEFIKKLKQDLEVRGVTRDPWNLGTEVGHPE